MRKPSVSRPLFTGAVLALAFAAASLPAALRAYECRALDTPDIGELAGIMRSEGLEFQVVKGPSGGDALVWHMGDAGSALVQIGRHGTSLNLSIREAGGRVTEEAVNAWNETQWFSRSYIEIGGEPYLETDLDYEGGICEGRVRSFLKTFRRACSLWKKSVPGS
ncbi:MAG: YbjN domain-containing protein [Deltaproteobacteria bacterium]|jgi:hypothetical protein|nr:YbjN domain-containing protein [Deltaproteobacteria bacterium]